MSPALKRGVRSDSFVNTPPGTYDRKKGKTGLVFYEGKGLPRLPGKRPNPRAFAVRYRPIGDLDLRRQDKLSMDDKATFDDFLTMTNLLYTQKDWVDPKEALLEEYQKLAGEVAIQGKDANPEIK
ncbi:uncharacterized protein PHALS_07156 [Plasmopara halstedii]|uniref:Uncharacterized protein n=1 Tax=Plasmopara halstedii TaxID=4781 RepID=A0A0P1B6X5_PLAHL|nr:uncharacterized protein PHALS_07156 [Plasmopara halstedii]CEG49391.1 hypothetical protein PHALS_07156 [Plasmopara halstedii]|eukprot:XP_024585760.1 hypothetical protein PHALS_07156 [Plasmopara halstedii]